MQHGKGAACAACAACIRTLASDGVGSEPHDVRARTVALVRRVDEAQVRAAAVVRARVVIGGRLATGVHHLNVEGLRERALHYGDVAAVPLSGAHHAVGAPVGPVDVLLEHGDGEGMRERGVTAQHLAVVLAGIVRGVHGVGARVYPVQAACAVVQRDAVGPGAVRHAVDAHEHDARAPC